MFWPMSLLLLVLRFWLLAVVSLVLINNTFNLLQLDTNLQSIAKGLIFVIALVFFMRGKAGDAN